MIYFDMDGTLADFYGVEGWLDDLNNESVRPYAIAKPRLNFSLLARTLHELESRGYEFGIVSWLSKTGSENFNIEVTEVKKKWLNKHLKSVKFKEIVIVPYGTPKSTVVEKPNSFLFDDEQRNRTEWKGTAYDVDNIISTLRGL